MPAIVIAAYENHVNRAVLHSPAYERCACRTSRGSVVYEIAEEDHAFSLARTHERRQTREIVVRRSLRHGDSGAAEGRRFAEVRIGDEQRRRAGPECCAASQKPQRLVACNNGERAFRFHDARSFRKFKVDPESTRCAHGPG